MADCTVCNICSNPGSFDNSTEINQIPSNVRKYQLEKFTMWRCRNCHSLHSKEDVSLEYYYEHYPFKRHKSDIWTRVGFQNRLKRLIATGLKLDDAILDFGCGKGLFVSFLQEKGYRNVAGYDAHIPEFSDDGILYSTYDCIIMQDVIEHVNEPNELIGNLAHHISLGGILCIGTPNAERIDLLNPAEFALSLHQPYHRHIFSEKALIESGKRMGLILRKIYHRYYYDSPYPTVNYRFLQTYIYHTGNVIDAAFEKPHMAMVLTSPLLLFYTFFGYFFPPLTEMMIIFNRQNYH